MRRKIIGTIIFLASAALAVGQTPNFEGIWNNSTLTPMERPAEFASTPVLTPQEAAAFAKRTIDNNNTDHRPTDAETDVVQGYNNFWWDRGTGLASGRTSLIIDPPDGRIPLLTAEARKRQEEARAHAAEHPADGPEDRSLAERCLTRGLPILPGGYNNNVQIVQTPEYLTILVETMHDVRIIPIVPKNASTRPHLASGIRQWLGDSRAHWEGQTLVIDTTNFSAKTNFRGSGAALHLTERLTLKDRNTLDYTFTVDDPSTFTKPWTASLPMASAEGPIFEYACNEGNYSMMNTLTGARAEEASH